MKVTPTELPGVMVVEPKIHRDERGFFFESFNLSKFSEEIGRQVNFVQDNHSRSTEGVLRGLHYQIMRPQGKLIRAISGRIFDVAVDIRRGSATFGGWVGVELSAENHKQLWVPEDYAHGFLVLSPSAEVVYKTTNYYSPHHERSIRWDDPEINIQWPESIASPVLSEKDSRAGLLANADLPSFPK